jgi:hypothetical protein
MSEELYYIQDKRSIVGNSLTWWRKGGYGYGCNILEAEVFTKERAWSLIASSGHKYRAWPKAYIDARISHHVDFQHLDDDQSGIPPTNNQEPSK